MKFKIRFANQIVGVFILLAILGIAAILILIGANQRWFARNYIYLSKFKSAEGLNVGMPIKLKGFEIGKVNTISLTHDNMVDIEFYIYDTYYDKAVPDSVLELASNPLGLGGGLKFHPGKGKAPPLPEYSFIPSLDLEEGKLLVEKNLVQLPKGEDVIGSVLGKVGPILDEVDATLTSVNDLVVSLDDSLKGKSDSPIGLILNDLTVTSGRINSLLENFEVIVANIDGIMDNIEETTVSMRDPTGLVKKLLDPKGSVATLLDDDNLLFDQIVESIEELNAIIRQLRDFSQFVNSTQPQISGLLEKGKTTLDQGKDVLEAIKNNPLLRGGVPERKEQQTTFQSYRDEDF